MIFTAHSIRSTLLLAAILTIGQHVDAEVSKGSDAWSIAEANVARRNFFGLVEMSEHAGVAEALASDAQIVALQNKRDQALQKAISDCHDAPCIDGAFRCNTSTQGVQQSERSLKKSFELVGISRLMSRSQVQSFSAPCGRTRHKPSIALFPCTAKLWLRDTRLSTGCGTTRSHPPILSYCTR